MSITPGTSMIFEQLITNGRWLFVVLCELVNEFKNPNTLSYRVERLLLNVSWFLFDWTLANKGYFDCVWSLASLLVIVFLGADWHLTGINRSEWSCFGGLSINFFITNSLKKDLKLTSISKKMKYHFNKWSFIIVQTFIISNF